jgi:hypothetical protein
VIHGYHKALDGLDNFYATLRAKAFQSARSNTSEYNEGFRVVRVTVIYAEKSLKNIQDNKKDVQAKAEN